MLANEHVLNCGFNAEQVAATINEHRRSHSHSVTHYNLTEITSDYWGVSVFLDEDVVGNRFDLNCRIILFY